MNKEQMELSLANRTLRGLRAERRTHLARFWFQRMHHVVDRALEWNGARNGRPEQKYLTLT